MEERVELNQLIIHPGALQLTRPKAKIYFIVMQLNTLHELLTAKSFFEESTVVRPVAMIVSLDLCCSKLQMS
jgi:hypothetical protein